MNKIILKGIIKNIQPSHTIKDIEYNKADIIVNRNDGKEDILSLKFKKFSNPYKENDNIELVGNIRSYSSLSEEGSSKVNIHVFTYFDIPQEEYEYNNICFLDGRVCKKDKLRYTRSGKEHFHFILANNIISGDHKLNSYIPCIIWGKDAVKFSENINIGDKISITGQLHSRQYTKYFENGECEFRVAHECVVLEYSEVTE